MAKRQKLDPAITERYVTELRALTRTKVKRIAAVKEIEDQVGDCVRRAFADGVKVGPMIEATGLSGSRIFQLKFAERDRELAAQ
jgi:hypothetical protein